MFRTSGNVPVLIILFIICVICGAIVYPHFFSILKDMESYPVQLELFNFFNNFLDSFIVINGNEKLLLGFGINFDKISIG